MTTESPPSVSNLLNSAQIAENKTNFLVKVTEAPSAVMTSLGDPLSHVGDGVFLQTKTAQGLAGIFVWIALFITCQQVN